MKNLYLKIACYTLFLTGLLIPLVNIARAPYVVSKDSTAKSKSGAQSHAESPVVKVVKTVNQPQRPEIIGFEVEQIAPTQDISLKKSNNLRDDNKISITISNPKDFILQRPNDKSQLILYADGFPLKGMYSGYFSQLGRQDVNDSPRYMPSSISIPFIFKRDSTNKEAWNNLFHFAHWNNNRITFKMSLGWDGMFPLNTAKNIDTTVTLFLYTAYKFWTLCLCYLVFMLYFIYLCHSTGLIREPDLNNKGPYSLSQTQLVFWTIIVIGGFIYLIVLTGLTDSLNNSILLLLGISGGTTSVASFIDYYKKITASKTIQVTQTNPAPENSAVAQNQVIPPVPAGQPIINVVSKKHRTFILDILSDGVNVSVQRAQIVLWNLVLGIYFIWYVITNKSMPVFSNTLLLLAGVSSLLYVGSKGQENPVTIKKE